jgi:hypothetical protein
MQLQDLSRTFFLTAGLIPALLAQSTIASSTSPQERLRQAHNAYDAHNYSEAARLSASAVADPAALNASWLPDALYDLACYQALAGNRAKALQSLATAIDEGYSHSPEDIMKDNDLRSLREAPAFTALLETLKRKRTRWSGDALASPFVPNLSEDERIAGLSKFWSEARFNFPFFERRPDFDWDALCLQYLPTVRQASTAAEYYKLLMRIAAELRDGHTNVYVPDALADDFYSRPGIRTELIGDSVVITGILDPALNPSTSRRV